MPNPGPGASYGAALTPGSAASTRRLPAGSALQQGKFTVGRVLGEGGFGITYKGAHTELQRPVAIKELFPQDPGLGAVRINSRVTVRVAQTEEFQRARASMLEEARVIASFQSQGIVDVYDMFLENGTAYIVMEYLEGQTLEARLEQTGRLPLDEVRRIAQEMCDALEEVHARRWLHRDIKPANIMLMPEGRAVLIDFGAARTFQADRTQKHTRIFTKPYAAPEQWSEEARFGSYTDVFCLGATLYHALTGSPPLNAMERLYNGQALTWPSGNPDPLHTALQQALELREEDRPPTMAVFRDLTQAGSPRAAPATDRAVPVAGAAPRPATSVAPRSRDRAALVALYQATDGAAWKRQAHWLSNASLDLWDGVTVDQAGRVIKLVLSSNQLTGSVPAVLGRMTHLRWLYLDGNQLSGPIPAALGNLTRLQGLDLSSNQLSGSMPAALGGLTRLQRLDLSSNQLSGSMPPELGHLIRLRWLYLGGNQLSGSIPAELNLLTNLKILRLEGNSISMPAAQNTGNPTPAARTPVPSTRPDAPPPRAQGTHASLQHSASVARDKDRAALVALYRATNGANWKRQANWLSNASLDTWDGVAVDQAGRVIKLMLASNQLSGSLPAELGGLIYLQELNLSFNQLSGSVPAELNLLTNLKELRLEGNPITPMPAAKGTGNSASFAREPVSSTRTDNCPPPVQDETIPSGEPLLNELKTNFKSFGRFIADRIVFILEPLLNKPKASLKRGIERAIELVKDYRKPLLNELKANFKPFGRFIADRIVFILEPLLNKPKASLKQRIGMFLGRNIWALLTFLALIYLLTLTWALL